MLQFPGHHQQIATCQFNIQFAAGGGMAKSQQTAIAETQRRNHWIGAQFLLVVGMAAHRIPTIAVQVGQHAVETLTAHGLDISPKVEQLGRPRQRHMVDTGISIMRAGITVPSHQSRHLQPSSVDEQLLLSPIEPAIQRLEQPPGPILRIKTS